MKQGISALTAAALACAAGQAQVVSNEAFENPPGSLDERHEFLEIYGEPGTDLTGYAIALVKGARDIDGDDRVIGQLGGGFIAMMQKLPQERLGAAVSNIAHAKQILAETIQYCHDRKAFGQSIGSLQHNKFLLAELVTKIEVAEAYVDAAVEAHSQKKLTPIDAAKAKWWSAEVQNEVLDHCVQLHGGYGFMNEYRVARAWRDARVTKIWAGSNEIMKELIGRDLGF